MSYKTMSYAQIRAKHYKERYEELPYLSNWRKCPYTYFKTIFYIELSSVALYFLFKTSFNPNMVSVTYGFLGIIAGVLLAIPNNVTVVTAAVMFFLKGVLDWADGPYARMTGRTSFTGAVLDDYSAFLQYISMLIGFGFYVANRSGNIMYYYMIPIIPFCYAANIINYSKIIITDREVLESEKRKLEKSEKNSDNDEKKFQNCETSKRSIVAMIYFFIMNLFDVRARGTDPICLLIILEAFTGIFFSWIIFLFLVFKNILWFFVSIYLALFRGVIENDLKNQFLFANSGLTDTADKEDFYIKPKGGNDI